MTAPALLASLRRAERTTGRVCAWLALGLLLACVWRVL